MLYTDYEAKIQKIVNIKNFVLKWKYLILGGLSAILTFIFVFLACVGIINQDITIDREEFVYGENISFGESKAFASKTYYEFLKEGENNWSEITPRVVGDYQLRTYSLNGYGQRVYGSIKKFRIIPKDIKLDIPSSIRYGDIPTLYSNMLASGDKIISYNINYDDILNDITNAQIETSTVRIENQFGQDVTSSYNIDVGEKKSVNITKRNLRIYTDTKVETYNGKELKSNEVKYDGSLADGDHFVTEPRPSALITSVMQIRNKILPTIDELQIKNKDGLDVTSKYNISYDEGYLRLKKRTLTIKGKDISTIYNGNVQYARDNTDYNKYEVTNLAEGHYVDNNSINFNSNVSLTYAGSTEIRFSNIVIRDSSNNDVTNNYDINTIYGKFEIKKRKIDITPIISAAGVTSIPKNNGSTPFYDFEKTYDGNSISSNNFEAESGPDQLCPTDKISFTLMPTSFVNPGTYNFGNTYNLSVDIRHISNGLNVNNSYDINFISNGKFDIKKRPINIKINDIELYESNSSILEDTMVHYEVVGDLNFVGNDGITFRLKNNSNYLSKGNYNFFNYFDAIYDDSKYEVSYTSVPKIIIKRPKLVIKAPGDSVFTYNGKSQSVNFSLNIIEEESELPLTKTSCNVAIMKSAIHVSKNVYTVDDIYAASVYYTYRLNNGSNRTLMCAKSNIDFVFKEQNYLEITSRRLDVKFKPPVKFYDGHNFNPDVLSEYYDVNIGSLAEGDKFVFSRNTEISEIGTYSGTFLKNNIDVKIFDSTGNNDVTSDYDFSYSFDDLEIIKIRIDIQFNIDQESQKYFYKTYNGEYTYALGKEANDYDFDSYGYPLCQRVYSNIDEYYPNLGSNGNNYKLSVSFGIDNALECGIYDVYVSSVSLEMNDPYVTSISESGDINMIDIRLINGENLYEIKRRNLSFELPNIKYFYTGEEVTIENETDINYLDSTSLCVGHNISLSYNKVSEPGTYTADDLNIEFRIFDSNDKDVTDNYNLSFINHISFRLVIEEVSVTLTSKNSVTRIYNGETWNERDFYSLVYSNVTSYYDPKHTYKIEFVYEDDVPDEYIDAVNNYANRKLAKIYWTKDGVRYLVKDSNITYTNNNTTLLTTNKKALNINIEDTLYYLSRDPYKVNMDNVTCDGLIDGDNLVELKINDFYSDFVSGINLEYMVSDTYTVNLDTLPIAQYIFKPVIMNNNRQKDVTNNYSITYSGFIKYKRAKLDLSVAQDISYSFDGNSLVIDNRSGYIINNVDDKDFYESPDVEIHVTYSAIETFLEKESVYYEELTELSKQSVGTLVYQIKDVKVNYKGDDITELVKITYNESETSQLEIEKGFVIFNPGNFILGTNYLYDMPFPMVTNSNSSTFGDTFVIEFGDFQVDTTGIYEITSDGYLKVLKEGTVTLGPREVRIFFNGEDVTSSFNIYWIEGTIEAVDISIS